MSTHRTTCCCGCGDNPCDGSVYTYTDTFWHQYVELKNNLITEYENDPAADCGQNPSGCNDVWRQHKEDHTELVNGLFSNLKGSCPVCAVGESSYSFPGMGSEPFLSSYPDMYELERDVDTNSYFHMGVVGEQVYWNSFAASRLDPTDENWRDIHWPDMTPPWRYQFAPPYGFLPWSPQVFAEWMVYWGGPLYPQGDCTMHCTEENIDCHKIAFVGNLGNYQKSGVVSSMKIATVPETPENNYENWEWIRNWVNSGGKLVIMGEWKNAQEKSFSFYKPGPFYESHVGNITCDVNNVWEEYPDGSMTSELVNDRLIEFAEFCAAEPDEQIEQFFDFGNDLVNEVWLTDSNHTHGADPDADKVISTCQKTKSPFRKEDENGNRKALPFYTTYAQGLVPLNKGKGLVGSCTAVHCPENCDNDKNCTVVWKKNGKGAVIVVYDSGVWGLTSTQIDYFQYSMLDESGSEEQKKVKHSNNDFWQFLCTDFLSEEGYEVSGNCGDTFWDNRGSEYEENPCLPTAACCLPDGSCENLNTWECTKKLGRWRGRLPDYLGVSSNVGKNGPDSQNWCNPSCSEIDEPCEPLTGGCCLCKGIDGACCLPNETCEIISQEACEDVDGEYQGQNTECLLGLCDLPDEPCTENEDCFGCDCCVYGVCKSCIGRPCNEETVDIDCQGCNCCVNNKCATCQQMFGACCLPGEGCIDDISQFWCESFTYNGIYQGDETFCNGPYVNCFDEDRGSCCICGPNEDSQECIDSLLPEECDHLNGVWQGSNASCNITEEQIPASNPECLGYGACCLPDESCQEMTCSDCHNNEGGIFQGDQIICTDSLCEQPEPPVMGTCCFYPLPGSNLPSQCYKVAVRSTEEDCLNLTDGHDAIFFSDMWPEDVECETPGEECSCIYMDTDISFWPACWTRNECFCNMTGGVWCCNTTCSEYWEGLDINANCEVEPQEDCTDIGCANDFCCYELSNGSSRCLPCVDPNEFCDSDIGCEEEGCCVCSGNWCGDPSGCCGICMPHEWCIVNNKLGACCNDGECDHTLKDSCVGHWFGPETNCNDVPCKKEEDCMCDFEFGACCFAVSNDDVFGTPCIPAMDTSTCEDPTSHDRHSELLNCQILTATECSDYDGYIDPVYGIEHRTRWNGLGSRCGGVGVLLHYATGECTWCEENGFKKYLDSCEEDSECAGDMCCFERCEVGEFGSCDSYCTWFCDGGAWVYHACESDSDCAFPMSCGPCLWPNCSCPASGQTWPCSVCHPEVGRGRSARCIKPEEIDNFPDFYEMVCECGPGTSAEECEDCWWGPNGRICSPPPEGEVRCNCRATAIVAWDTKCHGCVEAPMSPSFVGGISHYHAGSSCSDIPDFCSPTNCMYKDICGAGWLGRCRHDSDCVEGLCCKTSGTSPVGRCMVCSDRVSYPCSQECHLYPLAPHAGLDQADWNECDCVDPLIGQCAESSCKYFERCHDYWGYLQDYFGVNWGSCYSSQYFDNQLTCGYQESCESSASSFNETSAEGQKTCVDSSEHEYLSWCKDEEDNPGFISADIDTMGACCVSDVNADEVGCFVLSHLDCVAPGVEKYGVHPNNYSILQELYKWYGPYTTCTENIETCCNQSISDNTCEETTDCNPGKCCDENMCVPCCESNNDCTIEGECCNEDEGICEECDDDDDGDCEKNDDCECGLCCNDGECGECVCELQCDWECIGNEMYPWDCDIETEDNGVWKYHQTCEEGCIDICLCDDDEDCESCECCRFGKCTDVCGSCCKNGNCYDKITDEQCNESGGTYFADMPCVAEEGEESVESLGGCPEPGEEPEPEEPTYPPQCLSNNDCPVEKECRLGRCRDWLEPRKDPDSMPRGACCCRNVDGSLGGSCSYVTKAECKIMTCPECSGDDVCEYDSQLYDDCECQYCTYMGDGIRCLHNPCEAFDDNCTSNKCDCDWFCSTWGSDEEDSEGYAATVYCKPCRCHLSACPGPPNCGKGSFVPESWWDSYEGSGWYQ